MTLPSAADSAKKARFLRRTQGYKAISSKTMELAAFDSTAIWRHPFVTAANQNYKLNKSVAYFQGTHDISHYVQKQEFMLQSINISELMV